MRGTIKLPLSPFPGGVREDVAISDLPDGSLDSSNNYLTSQGVGTVRPGYIIRGTMAAGDRIIGIGIRGDLDTSDDIVLHSLTAAEHWDGSSQDVITGTWAASTADQLVRMVTYESGGTTWLLRTNAANAVDKWDGTGAAFQNIAAAPAGIDMTVVGGYVIVGKANSRTVEWNSQRDVDTWPSTASVPLLDSPGTIVAVRSFGPESFAVYKTDLVYIATLQPSEIAFSFKKVRERSSIIGGTSGPVSPAAVVEIGGWHYWLSLDNAIRRFNGEEIQVVSRGLQRTIQQNINIGNRSRVHGIQRTTHQDENWWWYPDSSTGDNTRGISLALTFDASKQMQPAVNPHTFTDSITASHQWKLTSSLDIAGLDTFSSDIAGLDAVWPDIQSMSGNEELVSLVGDESGNFYQFGQAVSDNATDIAWEASHGYRTPAGLGTRLHLDGVASFWKKTTASCIVSVEVTPSDTAAGGEGAVSKTIDLSQVIPGKHVATFKNQRGMFMKVKFSGTRAVDGIEFRGALVMGWGRNMV